MNFTQFQQLIPRIKKSYSGGQKAQFEMAPTERVQFTHKKISASKPKKAAVLALFYPDTKNHTHFLLILRASYNGTHSAQISFPGGKKDKNDASNQHTALRETFEEVGIDAHKVTFIKELTEAYIPPSNFLVTPFIGYLEETPTFNTNEEVEAIIEVKLSDLLNDDNVIIKNMSTSYMENIDVPCYKLNNYTVWGATAMILSEIKCILKEL